MARYTDTTSYQDWENTGVVHHFYGVKEHSASVNVLGCASAAHVLSLDHAHSVIHLHLTQPLRCEAGEWLVIR